MEEKRPMIETKSLSYTYEDEEGETIYALKDVSLQVYPGEFVAIIGTNGSGKSTLAKHFNALLHPTSGECLVNGLNTTEEENIWTIRQHVGMVFQNPDNQIVSAIVEEDVAFGPENLGIPSEDIQNRVKEALDSVSMTAFAKHAPHLLSGGQKQRVAIAGILAMQSDCIVLDEPTAMLDPKGRQEVVETVLALNKERGITIVYITHFMEEAAYADRVIVMKEGRMMMEGAPRDIFSQVETLQEMGLAVPVAAEVAHLLRQKEVGLPERLITNEELGEALCQLH